MNKILDLHIHSKYSRACSKQLTIRNIAEFCQKKGVDIIATGDFTHPAWFREIKTELEEDKGSGLYKLKQDDTNPVRFILSTEVALIYKDKGEVRRIHLMIQAPNLESVGKLNNFLDKNYNIKSDGRPILGMSAPRLVELCLSIHPKFLIYPAHIWTPWFAVFGSKSGFNSMEECFDEQTKHVYAYETGLSSDPEMNWRLSVLDNLTLLSSSDAHSLPNIAREANVMDLSEKTSYEEIYEVIKNKDLNKFKYTIEFYPEEGMYHYDGHRNCNFSCTPQETKKHRGICPVCKKPLTVGVSYRVDELADRKIGFKPENSYPYKKLIELDKIIAGAINIKSRSSKKVQEEYENLIEKFGSELHILLHQNLKDLEGHTDFRIIEGIKRVRHQELIIKPGYDGTYGVINIFKEEEKDWQNKLL